MHALLSTLVWDPQIRGFLIFLTGFVLLPGSVYLLLATNNGIRVGFMIALAGLSGWVLLLSIVWATYGIGMIGDSAQWRLDEIVTGNVAAHTATPVAEKFPQGWTPVPAGDPSLAEAQASADGFLITPSGGAGAHFSPPFKQTQDYVSLGGWKAGGGNYLFKFGSHDVSFTIRRHKVYLFHNPRYFLIRVQPSLPTITLAGAATTLPQADPTKPVTTVILTRDDGSKRMPPFFLGLSSLLVFGVCTHALHRRDRQIMALRAAAPAAA